MTTAVFYRCILSDPAETDLELPISSFSMRLRQSPAQCYLSVIIPKILDYSADIALRSDGTIKVFEVIGQSQTELLEADVSDIRLDIGPTRRTGSIVGYRQITFPGTGNFNLDPPRYFQSNNGRRRYRVTPHAQVKPRDTVIIDGGSIIAGELVWTVGQNQRAMEVSEAES